MRREDITIGAVLEDHIAADFKWTSFLLNFFP